MNDRFSTSMTRSLSDEPIADIATVLKALSDPNRLRILATLMTGDSCNCELQDKLGLASNLLSHHLRVLEKAALVHSRRDQIDARWIYYSVDRETAARWHDWFSQFLDPARIQERPVCGPEGRIVLVPDALISRQSRRDT